MVGMGTIGAHPVGAAGAQLSPGTGVQSSLLAPDQSDRVALVEVDGDSGGSPVTRRYGTRAWIGEPDDSQADWRHRVFPPRAALGFRAMRSVPLEPGGVRGAIEAGQVELFNRDGGLDGDWENTTITGHPVRIYFGPRRVTKTLGGAPVERYSDSADLTLIQQARALDWQPSMDRLAIGLGSAASDLEIPAQPLTYAGTGGAEGGAALKGKSKPWGFGPCRNTSPPLINEAEQIYQLSARGIQGGIVLRDRGVVLTPSGVDYPTYAALEAAITAPAKYDTCYAEGFAKYGSVPDGQITADFQGDAEGGYITSTGEICKRLIVDILGLGWLAIDAASFDGLPDGPVQYYLEAGDTKTAATVLDELLGGVGAWWGGTRDGRIRAGRLSDPLAYGPSFTITARDLIAVEFLADLLPIWSVEGLFNPNWTVQTDLTGNVVDPESYAAEGYTATVSDATIKTRAPLAEAVTGRLTYFVNETDAQAVFQREIDLFGTARQLVRGTLRRPDRLFRRGEMGTLRTDRYGLAAGKVMTVVQIEEDSAEDVVALTMWR